MLEYLRRALDTARQDYSDFVDPDNREYFPTGIWDEDLQDLAPMIEKWIGDFVEHVKIYANTIQLTTDRNRYYSHNNYMVVIYLNTHFEDLGVTLRFSGCVKDRNETRGFELNTDESWQAFREACKRVIHEREVSNHL